MTRALILCGKKLRNTYSYTDLQIKNISTITFYSYRNKYDLFLRKWKVTSQIQIGSPNNWSIRRIKCHIFGSCKNRFVEVCSKNAFQIGTQ